MKTFDQNLEKYAELIVKVGVNVQPGQEVFVIANTEMTTLARLIARKAYEAGSANVQVDWSDEALTRLKYEHAPDELFTRFPEWEVAKRDAFLDKGAAFISISSPNPDLLKDIDPKRIGNYQKTAGKALERFRRYMQSNKVSWTVVAAATKDWAVKVYPDAGPEEAVSKLWEAIFKAVRLHAEDPVQAWKEHDATLHEKVKILNNKKFHKLHYIAPGTDLTIELPENHLWVGAGSINEKGIPFMANMPTEEVFTAPHKHGTNGYVSSTKPLNYGGNVIDRFKLTFENGRIVKVEAEQGQEILQQLVDSDEGSHYLGEVALVPHESPISQSNTLFFNTLFDENASNHLAIGSAYAFNLADGQSMSKEELEQKGLNHSLTHVDFMIGSAEMDIDGIQEDGTVVPVFRKGNWAI
jgi:aminopeptidase